MLDDHSSIEILHLTFLRLLCAGRDRGNYVVKGGCNMRFFFGSRRYSEALDLDVRGVPQATLKDRVDAILDSQVFRESLRAVGIDLRRATAPKQTPTTQRWKIMIGTRDHEDLGTKVECSRRGADGETAFEAVDPHLLRRHRLGPVYAAHYLLHAAIRQKVRALIDRREVQARDVFDLSLLFTKAGEDLASLADLAPRMPAAVERVWDVSWADYRGQVAAYLEPDSTEVLGSQDAWDAIQLQVVSTLERIGGSS